MGLMDWMKGSKQEPVKLKVSDFNPTAATEEDVVIIGDDSNIDETHASVTDYHEPAQQELQHVNHSTEQRLDRNETIDWAREIDLPEYGTEKIIDLLATELFDDKNIYNILAEKVAQKLTTNILEHKHQIKVINVNAFQSRTDKIKAVLYPILETEIKSFVNEKIGGKL